MRCLWLLLALMPLVVQADEREITELLGRIRQSGAVEFSYQETRKLELTTFPWQGQGQMLSGADGSLIKLQLLPRRVIMVSTHQRMYFWDPEQQQRHNEAVGQLGTAAEQVTLLRSIIQGRVGELQLTYDVASEKSGKHWLIRFTPKPEFSEESSPTMEFSGDQDNTKHQVLISTMDGESTEYRMVKVAEGQEVENSIQRLLLEAKGD
jgi:hypothetical protein